MTKKKPPIVNAVSLCVKHNWPDHKYILDPYAVHNHPEWSKRDKTYYTESAVTDQLIMERGLFIKAFKRKYYSPYRINK